jgi:hypothetical protein
VLASAAGSEDLRGGTDTERLCTAMTCASLPAEPGEHVECVRRSRVRKRDCAQHGLVDTGQRRRANAEDAGFGPRRLVRAHAEDKVTIKGRVVCEAAGSMCAAH